MSVMLYRIREAVIHLDELDGWGALDFDWRYSSFYKRRFVPQFRAELVVLFHDMHFSKKNLALKRATIVNSSRENYWIS